MTLIVKVIIGLFLLSLIMFFHEGGHYLAGLFLKFKVLSFNIFMGPNIFSKRAKNGVRYNLKSFPIGASVEFAGELSEDSLGNEFVSSPDENEGSEGELFFERPRWARAIVAFAGPFANFLTAFLAFLILFSCFGVTVPVQRDLGPDYQGPAQRAGLVAGDRILSINGKKLNTAYDLASIELFDRPTEVELKVKKASGQSEFINFQVETIVKPMIGISYDEESDGSLTVATVDPRSNEGSPVLQAGDKILSIGGIPAAAKDKWNELLATLASQQEPLEFEILRNGKSKTIKSKITELTITEPLGISFAEADNFGQILMQAVQTPYSLLKLTVRGFGMMFRGDLALRDSLAGPVRMVQIVGDTVQASPSFAAKLENFLLLFGLLSVGIGFTQLIPIPPFDGHHLLILAIEGVRRKDLSVRLKHAIATAGFVLLIVLLFLTLYLDITNIFN
ncbi:MAG: RIP metalloprotease RseP [Eubacteriales bacterium]|nr:RIP metalloprotease RseP [Eubacteriales bacterium]